MRTRTFDEALEIIESFSEEQREPMTKFIKHTGSVFILDR